MIPPKLDPQSVIAGAQTPEAVRRRLGLDQVRDNLVQNGAEEKKLKKAVEGFESMFIQKLWQQMRKSVPKEGYLHSKEEDMYLSMFDEELAKKMSSAGGIGLGQMLYDELHQQLVNSSKSAAVPAGEAPEIKPLKSENMTMDQRLEQIRSLDEINPIKALDGSRRIRAEVEASRTKGLGDSSSADSLEPDFDPLADVSTEVRDAVAVPPEIMKKVMNLAARLQYQNERESVQREAQSAPAAAAAAETVKPAATLIPSADTAQAAQTPQTPGTMNWPVQGDVVSGFGWRTDAVTGSRQWHSGVDIAGTEGDPVQSCWDGEVVFSGARPRYGNLVIVEHAGGWRSYYGHNKANLVSQGQKVTSGSKIAELGQTGRADSPALHFEIRQGEQAMNPQEVRESMQAGLLGGNGS